MPANRHGKRTQPPRESDSTFNIANCSANCSSSHSTAPGGAVLLRPDRLTMSAALSGCVLSSCSSSTSATNDLPADVGAVYTRLAPASTKGWRRHSACVQNKVHERLDAVCQNEGWQSIAGLRGCYAAARLAPASTKGCRRHSTCMQCKLMTECYRAQRFGAVYTRLAPASTNGWRRHSACAHCTEQQSVTGRTGGCSAHQVGASLYQELMQTLSLCATTVCRSKACNSQPSMQCAAKQLPRGFKRGGENTASTHV